MVFEITAVVELDVKLRVEFSRAEPAVTDFDADHVIADEQIVHRINAILYPFGVFGNGRIKSFVADLLAVKEKFVIAEPADIRPCAEYFFVFRQGYYLTEKQSSAVKVYGYCNPFAPPVGFVEKTRFKGLFAAFDNFARSGFDGCVYEISRMRFEFLAAVLYI